MAPFCLILLILDQSLVLVLTKLYCVCVLRLNEIRERVQRGAGTKGGVRCGVPYFILVCRQVHAGLREDLSTCVEEHFVVFEIGDGHPLSGIILCEAIKTLRDLALIREIRSVLNLLKILL